MSTEEDDEEILSPLAAIRERPGMYVGGTDKHGLHHLLFWALDDIGANARAGRGTKVVVRLFGDNLCEITDDGPPSSSEGPPTLPLIEAMTSAAVHDAPRGVIPDQQQRTYLLLLRALSAKLTVQTTSGGRYVSVTYQRGREQSHVAQASSTPDSFTARFQPDPFVFGDTPFDVVMIRERLRQVAATTGLRCELQLGETDTVEDLSCPNGVADLLRSRLDPDAVDYLYPYGEPFRLTVTEGDHALDVALLWPDSQCGPLPLRGDSTEWIASWANTVRTREGTHLLGLLDALRSASASRPCPLGVLSVFLPAPRLASPVKDRLINPEIRRFVSDHVAPALRRFVERDAELGLDILKPDAATAEPGDEP